eukprot:7883950-Pyramimonas_sp.AAC.1
MYAPRGQASRRRASASAGGLSRFPRQSLNTDASAGESSSRTGTGLLPREGQETRSKELGCLLYTSDAADDTPC